MTTALTILAIATAISLVMASSGSGLVTSAFAAKKVLTQLVQAVVVKRYI
jgi:hypothetical protein